MEKGKTQILVKYLESTISWWLPVVLLVGFYSPGLFNNKVRIEPIYSISVNQQETCNIESYNQDAIKVNYPYWIYKRWVMENHESWEWNPYNFSGQPLWGESTYGFFSLRTLLTYILPASYAFTFAMFLHGLLLIIFSNLILDLFDIKSIYKALSVVIISFSTESLSHQQNSYSEFSVWLLAGIWIIGYLWRSQKEIERLWLKFALLGGILWAFAFYINHPLFQALHLIIFFIFTIVAALLKENGKNTKANRKIIYVFFIILIITISLSAWQWLPTYETLNHSYRSVTPKGAFLPLHIRIMPFAMPYDATSQVLKNAFNFIHSDNLIHMAGFDGYYISITLLFLVSCIFFDQRTRMHTKVLWLPYIIIYAGYFLIALIATVPLIRTFLMSFNLLQSVNLSSILAPANLLLYLLSGFGLLAFARLCKQGKAKRLLIYWILIVLVYIITNFAFAHKYRSILTNSYIQSLESYGSFGLSPEVMNAIITSVKELINNWNPLPTTFAIAIIVIICEYIFLILININVFKKPAILGFIITSAIIGYTIESERYSWIPVEKVIPKIEAIDFIKSQESIGRIIAISDNKDFNNFLLKESRQKNKPIEISMQSYIRYSELPFMPAMSLLYRVEDIRGVSPLNNRDYRVFLESVKELESPYSFTTPQMLSELVEKIPVHQRSWNLLNTKWVLSPDELNYKGYKLIKKGPLNIYQNLEARPRAWFTDKYRVIPDRKDLLIEMTKYAWNPDEILLETEPNRPENVKKTSYGMTNQEFVVSDNNNPEWRHQRSIISLMFTPIKKENENTDNKFLTDKGSVADIKWIERSSGYNHLQVNASGNGLIFFSEVFYPGWKVRVDGNFRDLYRADYTLMAMPIEKGKHTVELYFVSDTRKIGFVISFITCTILIILLTVFTIYYFIRKK